MFLVAAVLAQTAVPPKAERARAFDCQGTSTAPPSPVASPADPEVRADSSSVADYVATEWSGGVALEGAAQDPDSHLGRCRAYYEAGSGGRVEELVGRAWSPGGACSGTVPTEGLAPGLYYVGLTFVDGSCAAAEAELLLRLNAAPALTVSGPALLTSTSSAGGEGTWTVSIQDDAPLPSGTTATLTIFDEAGEVEASGRCTTSSESSTPSCEITVARLPLGAWLAVATVSDVDGVEGASTELPVAVNDQARSVSMGSPLDGLDVEPAEAFAVTAEVEDAWSTAEASIVAWYEDQDGVLSTLGDCAPVDDDDDGVSTCTIDEAFALDPNGDYLFWVAYDDGYGTIAYSSESLVRVNDTPTARAEGIVDGTILRPGATAAVELRVGDVDAPYGTVTRSLLHEADTTADQAEVPLDADGAAYDDVTFERAGTYTLWYTFEDSAGAGATTDPVTVYANEAPTLDLAGLSGTTQTIVRAREEYSFSFTTADEDDDNLTATCGMASVRDDLTTLTPDGGSYEGLLGCTFASLSFLSPGTRLVTVTVTDDHETTTDTFWIEISPI